MRLGGLKKFFSRDTDEKLEIEIKTEERDIEQEKQALEQERLEEKERQQALIDEENAREVAEVHQICAGKEKDKVWAFCAGQYSNDFRGNPKYLFLYINNYRKDIVPYWLCDDVELVECQWYKALCISHGNTSGRKFGISAIPAYWFLDREIKAVSTEKTTTSEVSGVSELI